MVTPTRTLPSTHAWGEREKRGQGPHPRRQAVQVDVTPKLGPCRRRTRQRGSGPTFEWCWRGSSPSTPLFTPDFHDPSILFFFFPHTRTHAADSVKNL
jgi:hypothetical protein